MEGCEGEIWRGEMVVVVEKRLIVSRRLFRFDETPQTAEKRKDGEKSERPLSSRRLLPLLSPTSFLFLTLLSNPPTER